MKSLLKGCAVLVLLLLGCSSKVLADPMVANQLWKLTMTNNTGMVVQVGFELEFSGTGGTMRDPIVVMNAPGAPDARAIILSSGSRLSVVWDLPGLPMGGTFMVQFTTDFGATPESGFWFTPEQKPIDFKRDNVTVQAVPEPVSLVLFATGLAGVALRSRKKLKRSA